MTILIGFLIASVVSSVMVVAAGMLSSRMSRPEEHVEIYYHGLAEDVAAETLPQAVE